MNMNAINVYPGQRVVTTAGDVCTVAMVRPDGTVLVYRAGRAMPVPAHVRCDAWGGEHDMAA
jgi:hypothetical protein